MDRIKIAVTGDKGGVGKTSLSALLTEHFLNRGKTVEVLDADPNKSLQTWIDKCSQKGRTLSTPRSEIYIVDTAGTSGAGVGYINKADFILVPFEPHVPDLEVVLQWFISIKEKLQEKVAFVPNKLKDTTEQREGLQAAKSVVEEEGRGIFLPGIGTRTCYAKLLKGRSDNYFTEKLPKEARKELETFFTELENFLGIVDGTKRAA